MSSRFEHSSGQPENPRQLLSNEELAHLRVWVDEYKNEGPDPDDFRGVYPDAEIEQDKKDLAEFQAKFERLDTETDKERELYATVVEMVLMDFSSSWMPGYLSRASAFDDIRRQTDLILETEDDDGLIRRISIDVTMSPDKAKKKVFQTLQRLLAGWFHDPKYFHSELENLEERARELKGNPDAIKLLMEMPRVVLGTNERKDIAQLAKLYVNYRTSDDAQRRNMFRTRIAELPIGGELRRLIQAQLNAQVRLMESKFGNNPVTSDLASKLSYLKGLAREFEEFGKGKTPGTELSRGHNKVAAAIAKELQVTLAT